MPNYRQLKIPAVFMRGGTSKGVFFRLQDLPILAQHAGPFRDSLLLRIIGSPDPYLKHIDGMGGGVSSNSKIVIIGKSKEPDHDVDYLFGQASIDRPHIDWSGNCGNLAASVGPFAIHTGFIPIRNIPRNGISRVRIRQANIGKTIVANVPIRNGEVQEVGDFALDGVPFPGAEIKLEYLENKEAKEKIFPTGNLIDQLIIPDVGRLEVTLVNSGIPTVIVRAEDIGLDGTELQQHPINNDRKKLEKIETIRTYASLTMGIIQNFDEISNKQHVPKIAFVTTPKDYTSSSGKRITAREIDLTVRAFSMGKLHHAMPATVSIAVGAAAAVPRTIVNQMVEHSSYGHTDDVCIGHPSGILKVRVDVEKTNDEWCLAKATMSRSARVLMEGWVRVPEPVI